MPVIIVEGNVLDLNKKREYIKALTKITAETYNLPESAVTILIKENEPMNIGVAGKLLIDKVK